MKKLRIGFLGFEGVAGLDLVGPWEALATADVFCTKAGRTTGYESYLIGMTRRPFKTETGLAFTPTETLTTDLLLDTLVVPGGSGIRLPATAKWVADQVRSAAPHVRRVVSICTGLYGVASTGLLDGRRVTSHWRFTSDLAQKFPRLKVDPNAIYVKDGQFYSCAGITAGIDITLALIEEDCGPAVALGVARELVVYMKRPGGQTQYSEPLHFQALATDRFAELIAWMPANLGADLSVRALAARVYLCPRHFSREFKVTFGLTPARFAERLRLEAACDRLLQTKRTVASVAVSVGFSSPDAFRRAFERRFGIPPAEYRNRFKTPIQLRTTRKETL